MLKQYEVKLNLNELLLLDGKVNEKAQSIIELAKKESMFGFELPVMNEILRKSEEIGTLKWTYKSIRSCSYCDKKYDYHTYPRNGRYHNKGDKNHDKPIYYSGIKFNEGFVTIQGHGDMCNECCNKHKVKEQLIDYIIDNDLKIQIQKNDYKVGKYLKDDIRICWNCNEEMQESQMGRDNTLMGDDTYPSKCPKCDAKSSAFGNSHKTTNKFAMIENPEFREEIKYIKQMVIEFNESKEKDEQIQFCQNRNYATSFSIKLNEHQSWNITVASLSTKTNTYTKESRYKDIHNEFISLLESYGYSEKIDERYSTKSRK